MFLATTYLGREIPSFRFHLNWSKVFVKSRFPRDARRIVARAVVDGRRGEGPGRFRVHVSDDPR